MAYGSEEGSAAYVGLERVTGSVHGRSGSFVLRHSAAMERGEGESSLDVVPDSGTGELRGLRGAARISVEPGGGHSFTVHRGAVEEIPLLDGASLWIVATRRPCKHQARARSLGCRGGTSKR